MYFAVTITVCPHKKIDGYRYKDYSSNEQAKILTTFFKRFAQFFDVYRVAYEICPTSNNVHAHLCIQPKVDHEILTFQDIMEVFEEAVINKFGYDNKTSKKEHYIKMEQIRTLEGFQAWEDYMFKEYNRSLF